MRDLYRFSQIFPQSQDKDSIENTLKTYNKSLLEKITSEFTQKEIEAQSLFDQKKYQESIDLLKTIPTKKYDFAIYSLFVQNYVWLKDDHKAITYLDKLLEQLDEHTLDEKLRWYVYAENLYSRLDNNERYIEFIEKEILIRKEIIGESFANNEFDEIITDKALKLADAYWRLITLLISVKSIDNVLYYTVLYLNTFRLIPNFDNERLKKTINENIKIIYLIFSPKSLNDNLKLLTQELINEIEPRLLEKINGLYGFWQMSYDLKIYNTSKNYNAVLKHANNIYEEIYPYVQNVKDTEQESVNMIFHFISNGIEKKVDFSFDDILLKKSESIIASLINNIVVNTSLDLFFDNLLSNEKLSNETLADNVLLEILRWNLWDFNKLVIWRNLFDSLHDQKKYVEAEKALKGFEKILESLNEQPLEEQISWIDIAYNLYFRLEKIEKQISLFYTVMKYLDNLFLSACTDINWLTQILESMKQHWKNVFNIHLSFLLEEENFQAFNHEIEKEINPRLYAKIRNLYFIQQTLYSFDDFPNSKYYDASLEHVRNIYETILPVIQSVNENEKDKYKNISIPFVFGTEKYDVLLPIDDMLELKGHFLLINLLIKVEQKIRTQYLDAFFENLLSDEDVNTSSETVIDEVLSNFLDWHILIQQEAENVENE